MVPSTAASPLAQSAATVGGICWRVVSLRFGSLGVRSAFVAWRSVKAVPCSERAME
jgi:hypothetical protein